MICFTVASKETRKTGTDVAIRGRVAVVANAEVLARLKNVTERIGDVAIDSQYVGGIRARRWNKGHRASRYYKYSTESDHSSLSNK